MLCQSCCHVLTISRNLDSCLSVSGTYDLSSCNHHRSLSAIGTRAMHSNVSGMPASCGLTAVCNLQISGRTCTTLHSLDALRASAQPATGSGTMSLTGPRSRWSASSRASAASGRAGSRWGLHSLPPQHQFAEDLSRQMQAERQRVGRLACGCMLALIYTMTVNACI